MGNLKLYLIWQDVNREYDTFDECVVCSESPEKAVLIRPDSETWENAKRFPRWGSWVTDPTDVQCKEIGTANDNYKEGDIICSSFNAG